LLTSLIGFSVTFSVPSYAKETTISKQNHDTITNHSNSEASLFINLTSDDIHRAGMAISFAQSVLKNGHETTIFLNITGVRIASTNIPQHINGMTEKSLQQMLQEFIAEGGTVIVCPTCLQQAGITPDQLIEGAILGSPDITQPRLFTDNVRVMSW